MAKPASEETLLQLGEYAAVTFALRGGVITWHARFLPDKSVTYVSGSHQRHPRLSFSGKIKLQYFTIHAKIWFVLLTAF